MSLLVNITVQSSREALLASHNHQFMFVFFFSICECTEAEAEIILQLKSELREKELKLTDIRLEALSSAHHLDQIREAMNRMQVSADARNTWRDGQYCLLPSPSYSHKQISPHNFSWKCTVYSIFVIYFLIPHEEISDVGSGKTNWSVAHIDHSVHLQVI